MDQFISKTYLLEKNPLTITLLDKEQTMLSLSTSYQIINMSRQKGGVHILADAASLSIHQFPERFVFEWKGKNIKVQFPIEGRWYGLGELVNQHWILNHVSLPLSDLLTADAGATGHSNLMSPVWMNEYGVLVIAHSPVKLGINQPQHAPTDFPEYVFGEEIPFNQRPVIDPKGKGDGLFTLVGDDLYLEVILAGDLVKAHKILVQTLGHPNETPPLSLFGAPVWTTWAQYKDKIDQELVLDFARKIKDSGFPYQVLEIDDRWQSAYGDLVFDPERFPDPKGMVDELHEMGFKVTAWVIPFMHKDSAAAQEAVEHGYTVQHQDGSLYLVRWWQGKAYLIDATNPEAMAWFGKRLHHLQDEVGIDGFKFDGGEAMYVPKDAKLHAPGSSRNNYSHNYAAWVAKHFSLCEVRTGWFNQTAPILFRIWDLWSTWGRDNGLRAIIPATLSLSITGYPFTFPDMIGGNGYFTFPKNRLLNAVITKGIIPMMEKRKRADAGDEDVGVHASDVPEMIATRPMFGWPTDELMIRWTQVNALLPVMQFSIMPWELGDKVAEICKQYTELHLDFAGLFEKWAAHAAKTGEPIIRPVYWLAPDDPIALECEDQFLVGDELLVAPVVDKGIRKRDIYLPPGEWRDHWTSLVHEGPTVLKDYDVPLTVLPFFHKE